MGLVLLAWLALGGAAEAQRLIVADVSPPSDDAGALTLLLRSYLSQGRRAVVPIGELMRTIKRVDKQRDRVEVRAGEESKLLGDLGADRLLVVEFDKSGPSLAASYKILLPTGTVLSAGRQLMPRGDYHRLAHAVASQAAAMLGTQCSTLVNVSLDELRPFARALVRYQRGDYTGAIAEMYRANQHLGDTLAAVRDLAAEVAHAPSLSEADRIQAARLSGDLKLAQQLGEKAKTASGKAENARTLTGHGSEEEASSAVGKLGSSKDPSASLARAELALRKGDKAAAEKDLAPLLAKRPPDPRAMALVADLPPGALSPETEKLAIEAAKDAKGGEAGMAGRIGVRAASAGEAEGVPLAQMDSVPSYQVKQMSTKLAAAAPAALKTAAKERGDQDGTTGVVDDMIGEGGDDPASLAEAAAAAGVPLPGAAGKAGKGGGKAPAGPPPLLADEKKPDAIAVADAFAPLLTPITALAKHPGEHAVLMALPDVEPWAFLLPRRGLLRSALRRVLALEPFNLYLAEASPQGPMTKAMLMQVASQFQPPASLVLAYTVSLGESEEGKRTAIRLVVLDTTTGVVQESTLNLEAGLAAFYPNPLWLGIIALFTALIGAWGYMLMFRTGSVVVELSRDASAEQSFTHVLLSRKPKPPVIDDLHAFMEKERNQPKKSERYLHTSASGKQTFDQIAAGRWYVHTYGVVVRGGEPVALAAGLTQAVTVTARDTVQIRVDLEKKLADLRLTIEDGGPKARVKAYLASRPDVVFLTGEDGKAVVSMPVGDHQLILELGEERFSLPIGCISTKTQSLTVDFPRERHRRKLEAGLAIVGHGDEAGAKGGGDDVPEQYRASAYQSQPEIPAAAPPNSSTRIGSAQMGSALPALGMLDDDNGPPSVGPPEVEMPTARPTRDMRSGSSEADLLGRYHRTGELGRGAMGVVYRGRDTSLEREVAIKVVSDEVRRNPDALNMFVAEAKAMAALNHPNLVTVFDQGQTDGELFMVMELVDGKTLETVLAERGPLPVTEVVDIGEQLSAGLQYAHSRRILHRDIKPANIFYSKDGIVKLGDFGLARAVQKVRLSQTKVSGTPLYMSPEQIRGTDIDFRSDLYSVGCTLYELLTGAPPFVTGEVLYHHMYTEPAIPSSKHPGIPPEVDALLMRCLAKDPAARPQTADELRQALRPLKARFT